MTDERREKPRRQVVGVRLQSSTLNGRIVDVSGTGIGIETPQCVSAGDRHEVKISYGGKTVLAKGAVRWTNLSSELEVGSSEVHVFRAGIELSRVSRHGLRPGARAFATA